MTKLFEGEAKGEIIQLRDQLDGNDPAQRKEAAKRTLALMRAGENVQSLFSSMLRCVKTSDIELKKLTYLYLISYSTHEPEQAIMAVNTFIQDSQDPNPLIRALAVRTMCRIRLESVAEYMITPLKKTLSDSDPYVRKTAALGVSKLYDVIPETVENAQLFDDLLKLLSDENPMVVSNTTAAIFEINERRSTPIFTLNATTITPILSALTSCSEWCQTILYDALAKYVPDTPDDANFLIERLVPFLKHKNPAVVIGSFKCIFMYMNIANKDPVELFPQIIPPFITLVTSSAPEIQYIVLRTLTLFVQKYPKALSREIRVFFCKYNDPSYIKMEKLNVMVTICTPQTAQLVLDELSEYCNEVDVAFVRRSISCIGQIAVKIEASARRCVDILVELVSGKADYAIEEAIVVFCDILRKFPGTFESVLTKVCSGFESIKEPRAKAAAIWILGEYCDLIESVDVLMDPYLDTFHDEEPQVQLQILSSMIKIYIANPDATKDQLQFILNEATKDTNVPDVKNRALIYWRILSADPQVAKDVVIFGKQTVTHSGINFDDSILEELIKNMGTVSGVLHVVPSDFVIRAKFVPDEDEEYITNDIFGTQTSSNGRNWQKLRLTDETIIDLFADYDRNNCYLRIVNKSQQNLSDFAYAINKNAIGLTLSREPSFPQQLEIGNSTEVQIPITFDNSAIGNFEANELQIAMRTSLGNVFACGRIPLEVATTPAGNIGDNAFRENFTNLQNVVNVQFNNANIASDSQFAQRNIFVVGKNGEKVYCSFALPSGAILVAEVEQTQAGVQATVKATDAAVLPIVQANGHYLFSAK
ncbi:Adaptin N terminal region family protein [Tritrichomonas foetus]|uniref:Adaptin N terminal region family protein n=1 Tax=Tritrichomonas foetus TaxID=1144522 RepID=A0A1J4KAJ1_9EUKA|nr:Adaptin N terminal region family protein [Tritrichomonas foetus]|eukprot:OHT06477.1 Adaptin N terminal region family protein [Tritrichomonas foetus]